MPVNHAKTSEIEHLYKLSIDAGIARLCKVGAWPRPPAAKKLYLGYDFYYDDIKEIPEADSFVQYLASDDTIKAIYFRDPSNPELYRLYNFWVRLLLFILSETQGDSPNQRVLNKWFRRFIKELYSETAMWRTVDTVTGLVLNTAKLKFDNLTQLTSIPGYELERIAGKYRNYMRRDRHFDYNWMVGGHDKATIITTITVPKRDYINFTNHPPPHLTKDIERALAAIYAVRLCKSGVPRLHCHLQFNLSQFPLDDPFSFSHHNGHFLLYEEETVINKRDFREIKGLWREIMETKYAEHPLRPGKPTPMDVALGRFSRTYELHNWLDHIVDLTIALESLFGPKEPRELRHRISLRVAWLLGQEGVSKDSSWSNTNILKRVRTMYDIRSARVHGGIPKDSDIRKWLTILSGVQYDESKHGGALYGGLLEKSMESARDIVRNAIRACAQLAKTGKKIPRWPLPDNFDEQIISPSQREIWQRATGLLKTGQLR